MTARSCTELEMANYVQTCACISNEAEMVNYVQTCSCISNNCYYYLKGVNKKRHESVRSPTVNNVRRTRSSTRTIRRLEDSIKEINEKLNRFLSSAEVQPISKGQCQVLKSFLYHFLLKILKNSYPSIPYIHADVRRYLNM